MARRLTEEFVHHFDLLISRAGNSPNNISAALNRDRKIAENIRELDKIHIRIEQYRKNSRSRFIVQADRKFYHYEKKYKECWMDCAMDALWEWETEQIRNGRMISGLDPKLLGKSSAFLDNHEVNSINIYQSNTLEWEFDADRHSVRSEVDFAESFLRQEAADLGESEFAAACSRSASALQWIRDTVGLDLAEIERRWKEFPIIVVPKNISDKHGIEDPHSLFGYLSQIRLAYISGADLAAIAMCRAATEILVRFHYNGGDKTTDLGPLIQITEKRRDGSTLKKWNIGAKVRAANDILHVNKSDIRHRDEERALVRDWVGAIQDMIVDRGGHAAA